MGTTPGECLDALREAADRLGESPSKAQYEDLGLTPASATVIRVIGGWNDAKRAANLPTAPSTGSRVQAPPEDGSAPADTPWAELSVDQRWHYRNVDRNTRRSLERRRRLRHWLRIHRSTLGCRHCGESGAACLDFHHVDGEKERAVTEMVTYGHSADAIYEELGKCEVLCANCHRAVHVRTVTHGRSGDAPTKEERMRTWAGEYQRRRGCRRCGEKQPAKLVFHHPDWSDKDEGVGAMISNSRPFTEVKAEARKCVVLCANCHRQEHDSTRLPDPESDRI